MLQDKGEGEEEEEKEGGENVGRRKDRVLC